MPPQPPALMPVVVAPALPWTRTGKLVMRTRHWRPIGWGLAVALLTLGLSLHQAWAAGPAGTPQEKFLSGTSVIVPDDETVPHDLYVGGNDIRIDGRIDGDLFVAGGTVANTGPVTGDLFFGGGTVTVSSSVDRSLRVAAGTVTVTGPVKLDLLAAAGTLILSSDSMVGGDLILNAGRATLDGTIGGSVWGSAESYVNGGSVGGSEDVSLKQQQPKQTQTPSVGGSLIDQLQRYLGIVLIGGLLLWLVPRRIQSVATRLRERPLPSLGVGVIAFIGFFVLVIGLLLGMGLLAIPVGLLGSGRLVLALVLGVLLGTGVLSYLFMLILLFVAAVVVVVGLTLGRLVLERIDQPWAKGPYVALLLGVLVVVALTAIPIIGGLLNALVVLLGLGALILRFWRRPAAPATAEPLALSGDSPPPVALA